MEMISQLNSCEQEQTHWTDEKHRLYLDSLEASFVQDLHQHRPMHALSPKQKMRRKPIRPDISSSEVRQHIHKKSGSEFPISFLYLLNDFLLLYVSFLVDGPSRCLLAEG